MTSIKSDNLNSVYQNGIMKTIELNSYDMYLINRVENIICVCVRHSTSQADPNCKICLGTGNKIIIRKLTCAAQDTQLSKSFRSDTIIVARNYFVDSKYKIKNEDLIIDDGRVYKIFEIQRMLSIKGHVPYNKVSTTEKRFDTNVLINNFNKIIKGR